MRRSMLPTLLLLSLLLCCATAHATPATPYDPALLMGYPSLTQQQQALFDIFYNAATQGTRDVPLPAGTTYDDATAAMSALQSDAPELAHLAASYSVQYPEHSPQEATMLRLSYAGELSMMEQTLTAARQLAAQVSGAGSDWEKALQLHDLLREHVEYREGTHAHNAYGALLEGQAVCDGYAEGYALMCRMAGIPCVKLSGSARPSGGEAGPHAWNVVVTSEGAMLVDVTWDDQESANGVVYAYFGLTDEMMGRDHFETATFARPACTDASLNWHARRAWFLPAGQGEDALRAWWNERLPELSSNPDGVSMRFAAQEDFALFLNNYHDWTNDYNRRMGAGGVYGSLAIRAVEAQYVIGLQIVQ